VDFKSFPEILRKSNVAVIVVTERMDLSDHEGVVLDDRTSRKDTCTEMKVKAQGECIYGVM